MRLIERLYDSDSYFFTQELGERPKFNQVRCWSEFDGLGETVSQLSVQIIKAALENAYGVTVEHRQFETTDVIDWMLAGPEYTDPNDETLPTAFDAQQDECAHYLIELLMDNEPEALFPRIQE